MYGDVEKQKEILKYLIEELKLDINQPTKLYGAVSSAFTYSLVAKRLLENGVKCGY